MYLFGLNPTICAEFQHLRELGVGSVRCATAGPFIKPLRFYWTPARENRYLPYVQPRPSPKTSIYKGIYVNALVSEGIGRGLYDTAAVAVSLFGAATATKCSLHCGICHLTCRPPSLPDEVTDQRPPVSEFEVAATVAAAT